MREFSPAFKIAAIYFIFSFIWILASDKILFFFFQDAQTLNFIQTIKGWFFITVTSLIIYTLVKRYFQKEKDLRNDIENIFNQTSTAIAVYDTKGDLLRVNKVWEESTGYNFQELNSMNKCAQIICTNEVEEKNFLSRLFNTNKKENLGEFTIKTKNNKELVWNLSCSPYGKNKKDKIVILTAIDITELRRKEKIIIQQSKMAALGEVLENIAHQWRQPLSTISTLATGIKTQKEQNILDDDSLIKSMDYINSSTQYLSSTIDDFRDFFQPNQEMIKFSTSDIFNKTILIVGPKLESLNIKVIAEIEELEIKNYDNALIQVLVNILNNANDALVENLEKNRVIFIEIKKEDSKVNIKIKDNAGGIKKAILNKIFEPYFTTKFKSKGTGIGLYMTEEIITKHMKGEISVTNEKFDYQDKSYKGALFTISLPLE